VWQCIDLQLSDLLLARGDAVAGADEQDARPVHLDDGVRIIGQLLKHQRSLAWKFAAAAAAGATGTRLNRHLQLIDVRRLKLSPRGRRDDMPPPGWQFDSRRISVRPRTHPQSAHLC